MTRFPRCVRRFSSRLIPAEGHSGLFRLRPWLLSLPLWFGASLGSAADFTFYALPDDLNGGTVLLEGQHQGDGLTIGISPEIDYTNYPMTNQSLGRVRLTGPGEQIVIEGLNAGPEETGELTGFIPTVEISGNAEALSGLSLTLKGGALVKLYASPGEDATIEADHATVWEQYMLPFNDPFDPNGAIYGLDNLNAAFLLLRTPLTVTNQTAIHLGGMSETEAQGKGLVVGENAILVLPAGAGDRSAPVLHVARGATVRFLPKSAILVERSDASTEPSTLPPITLLDWETGATVEGEHDTRVLFHYRPLGADGQELDEWDGINTLLKGEITQQGNRWVVNAQPFVFQGPMADVAGALLAKFALGADYSVEARLFGDLQNEEAYTNFVMSNTLATAALGTHSALTRSLGLSLNDLMQSEWVCTWGSTCEIPEPEPNAARDTSSQPAASDPTGDTARGKKTWRIPLRVALLSQRSPESVERYNLLTQQSEKSEVTRRTEGIGLYWDDGLTSGLTRYGVHFHYRKSDVYSAATSTDSEISGDSEMVTLEGYWARRDEANASGWWLLNAGWAQADDHVTRDDFGIKMDADSITHRGYQLGLSRLYRWEQTGFLDTIWARLGASYVYYNTNRYAVKFDGVALWDVEAKGANLGRIDLGLGFTKRWQYVSDAKQTWAAQWRSALDVTGWVGDRTLTLTAQRDRAQGEVSAATLPGWDAALRTGVEFVFPYGHFGLSAGVHYNEARKTSHEVGANVYLTF